MRKPTNCWCEGAWKVKIPRWGCLKREEKRSLLYCKDCRQEWWSFRRYAASVPMWTKQVRSGLTDQDMMNRIVAGTLRVRERHGKVIVESVTPNRGVVQLKQIERQVHPYTTYRFVVVSAGGLQRKVAVHRLNWMAHHMRLVPAGYHVDHEKGRSDLIRNLRLLPAADNCRTNT